MSDDGLVRNASEGVNPKTAGWTYLSFRTVGCRADEIMAGETGADETALIWLGGRAEVDGFGQVGERDDVFSGLPSALLLPPGASYTLRVGESVKISAPAATFPYELQIGPLRNAGTMEEGRSYDIAVPRP